MLKQLTATLLKASLAELTPAGYKQSDDRILAALDKGRNAVYPVQSRTAQQMTDITLAYQEATRQIAKTLQGKDLPDEEHAYLCLMLLGKTIPLAGLKFLLERTLARLEQEEAGQPEATPAAP